MVHTALILGLKMANTPLHFLKTDIIKTGLSSTSALKKSKVKERKGTLIFHGNGHCIVQLDRWSQMHCL